MSKRSKRYGEEITKIKKLHYQWCKKEGRDTSWYIKSKTQSSAKSVKQQQQ